VGICGCVAVVDVARLYQSSDCFRIQLPRKWRHCQLGKRVVSEPQTDYILHKMYEDSTLGSMPLSGNQSSGGSGGIKWSCYECFCIFPLFRV
jgi:hypothetical protein